MAKSFSPKFLLLLALFGIPIISFASFGQDGPKIADVVKGWSETDPMCGPNSMLAAAARIGVVVDRKRLVQDCALTDQGTSFSNLAIAAKKQGIVAEGYRLSWENLIALQTTAILLVRAENFAHFIAVDPREIYYASGQMHEPVPDSARKFIRAYDAPNTAFFVARADLDHYWGGGALVLTREGVPAWSRPAGNLQVDELLYDFGRVAPGVPIQYVFGIRNIGKKDVTIKRVDADCICTVVKCMADLMKPGQRTEVQVSIDTRSKLGKVNANIYIFSDDPQHGEIPLLIQGVVRSQVIVPQEVLDFGDLPIGTSIALRACAKSVEGKAVVVG